jgi:MFS family permease
MTLQEGTHSPAAPPAAGEDDYPRPAVAWWSVVVFFLLYGIAFLDRQMLNILVVPIQQTMGISDFEISLLQGFTFAVFYTVLGIPIGWFVDNSPRRRIVFLGLVFWSIASSACGLAIRYWHLLLGRIGVAAGEAVLAPAAYSMMSDIFPPGKLALPMSIMGTGAAVGGALSAVMAGVVVDAVPVEGIDLPLAGNLVGWQVALLLTGIPGLLFAPLIYTVPDQRRHKDVVEKAGASGKGIGEAMRFIHSRRGFYYPHFLGFGLYSMCNYGLVSWLAVFFMRQHDWSLSQTAMMVGVLTLFVGVAGGALMGFLVDRWYSSGRKDAHMLFFAGCALLQAICVAAMVLSPDARIAVAFLVLPIAVGSFTGVAGAALQIVTPGRMRGQVSAVYLLVFNMIGLGCGPTIVAVFTDYVFRDESMVGWSLVMTFGIFAPIAAILMLMGARAIRSGLMHA